MQASSNKYSFRRAADRRPPLRANKKDPKLFLVEKKGEGRRVKGERGILWQRFAAFVNSGYIGLFHQ